MNPLFFWFLPPSSKQLWNYRHRIVAPWMGLVPWGLILRAQCLVACVLQDLPSSVSKGSQSVSQADFSSLSPCSYPISEGGSVLTHFGKEGVSLFLWFYFLFLGKVKGTWKLESLILYLASRIKVCQFVAEPIFLKGFKKRERSRFIFLNKLLKLK